MSDPVGARLLWATALRRHAPRMAHSEWLGHFTGFTLIERNPPPPGGVSIYYVPWSRAVCTRFHEEMRWSHLVVKSLTHGSWSENIVNRKPPRGGGFLSINLWLWEEYEHICEVTHSRVWHDPFICMTWLNHVCDVTHHTCDVTHSCVWRDSFICVTWLISYVWRDSFIRVTWLISYVWRDSFIRVTWLIHTCDMTYSYVWRDLLIRVTWLTHTCDVAHSHAWHGSFTRVTWLIHTCDLTYSHAWRDLFILVIWLIHMRDVTNSHVWRDSFIRVTWLVHPVGRAEGFEAMGLRDEFIKVWLESFICVTWPIHMCDVTHSCAWRDLSIQLVNGGMDLRLWGCVMSL